MASRFATFSLPHDFAPPQTTRFMSLCSAWRPGSLFRADIVSSGRRGAGADASIAPTAKWLRARCSRLLPASHIATRRSHAFRRLLPSRTVSSLAERRSRRGIQPAGACAEPARVDPPLEAPLVETILSTTRDSVRKCWRRHDLLALSDSGCPIRPFSVVLRAARARPLPHGDPRVVSSSQACSKICRASSGGSGSSDALSSEGPLLVATRGCAERGPTGRVFSGFAAITRPPTSGCDG